MASGIRLLRTAAVDIVTPPTDKITVFMDDATGEPSYKDDTGTVTTLVGADGVAGAAGVDGSTWYTDAGAPGGGLGINGDYYLDSVNGDYYLKAGGVWGLEGNLQGATGATGAAGSTLNPAAFIYAYNAFR